jgi:queuine tRNA-ribosyltransferase
MSAYPNFSFTVSARDGKTRARRGTLATPHGSIETPAYIFCGTKATIKGLTMAQVREAGAEFVLANTYHLMVQPGADTIETLGGLHKVTSWDGPMLTDSGGFQIFSLGAGLNGEELAGGRALKPGEQKGLTRIKEEGAYFRSYVDGSKLFLSPETSMDVQRKLGADFIVQLDECTPFKVSRDYTARSMALSQRWGDRSLAQFARHDTGAQAVYGIVQGGIYPDLRQESAQWTRDRNFFGTAIGGVLGSNKEFDIAAMCMPHVHPDRPVHLLGIGTIADVFIGVRDGIDTFDCVTPTRIARHGWALAQGVPNERLSIRNARFRQDTDPLDPHCNCYTCRTASRGYLHHLFKAGEMTGMALLSIHNIATMARLMREVRAAIETGTLDELEKRWLVM